MRLKLRAGLVIAPLCFSLTTGDVWACAFDYQCIPYYRTHPEPPYENFARGQLGIFLPTFRSTFLFVAYRYLSGLPLSEKEIQGAITAWKREAQPVYHWQDPSAITEAWIAARSNLAERSDFIQIEVYREDESYQAYLNCPKDAFDTAAVTLQERIKTFGRGHPEVSAWVHAQDQVFSNCGKPGQIPAETSSPPELARYDRAYQIAAAHFYAGNYAEAQKRFEMINNQTASPWTTVAPYMICRVLLRQASLGKLPEVERKQLYQDIEKRLMSLIGDPAYAKYHKACRDLLSRVHWQLEPDKEYQRLVGRLAGGKSDDFAADLFGFRAAYGRRTIANNQNKITDDLTDWIETVQALAVSDTPYSSWAPNISQVMTKEKQSAASRRVVAQWKSKKTLPWLAAAVMATSPGGSDFDTIRSAVEKLPKDNPGSLFFNYHRLLWLDASGQKSKANQLSRYLLSTKGKASTSVKNLLRPFSSPNVISLRGYLLAAAIEPVTCQDVINGEGSWADQSGSRHSDNQDQLYWNQDLIKELNLSLPLDTLAFLSSDPTFPKPLRRRLIVPGWVRAVLLERWDKVDQLSAVLTEDFQFPDKSLSEIPHLRDINTKRRRAHLLLMRYPQMRPDIPYLTDRFEDLNHFTKYDRDGWWHKGVFAELSNSAQSPIGDRIKSWLSAEEKQKLQQENQSYSKIDDAIPFFCRTVAEWSNEPAPDGSLFDAIYQMASHLSFLRPGPDRYTSACKEVCRKYEQKKDGIPQPADVDVQEIQCSY